MISRLEENTRDLSHEMNHLRTRCVFGQLENKKKVKLS